MIALDPDWAAIDLMGAASAQQICWFADGVKTALDLRRKAAASAKSFRGRNCRGMEVTAMSLRSDELLAILGFGRRSFASAIFHRSEQYHEHTGTING
jgi:hypothetical protein